MTKFAKKQDIPGARVTITLAVPTRGAPEVSREAQECKSDEKWQRERERERGEERQKKTAGIVAATMWQRRRNRGPTSA